jgi:hypothetical protein
MNDPMNKRLFLAGAAGLAAAGARGAAPRHAAALPQGPALLTVSGRIGRANRGPLDPALDQMMAKQGLRFDQAYAFDAAALQRLPAVRIRPTLEYDAQPHTLQGPLLTSVLQAAGVAIEADAALGLRAVDGYNVIVPLKDAAALRMLVATHIDGKPLGLGGLGPQWAVFDPEGSPAWRDKPLKERFGLCPWALYHVDVR